MPRELAQTCTEQIFDFVFFSFSPGELFTRVFFMFPHVGGKSKINLNRDLMKRFAENIASKLYNQCE